MKIKSEIRLLMDSICPLGLLTVTVLIIQYKTKYEQDMTALCQASKYIYRPSVLATISDVNDQVDVL